MWTDIEPAYSGPVGYRTVATRCDKLAVHSEATVHPSGLNPSFLNAA